MTDTKSCAFTGHRPQKLPWGYNEADARCVALKEMLAKQIALLVESGVTEFLTGMAEGVDIWCAQSVLALKENHPAIRLRCVIPYEAQAEKWSVPSQELYRSILGQSDSIIWMEREYTTDCMMKRNRYLVDNADILLAVSSGSDEQRGGTAATVRYAKKAGREMWLIDPVTLLVTHEKNAPEAQC